MPLSVTISWIGLRGGLSDTTFPKSRRKSLTAGGLQGPLKLTLRFWRLSSINWLRSNFFYNLTTCIVPEQESISQISTVANSILVSRLNIYDPLYDWGVMSQNLSFGGIPIASGLAGRSYGQNLLLDLNHLEPWDQVKPFTWVDQLGVMVWALSKIAETEELPFVLHYDLRPYNVMINNRQEIRYLSYLT